MICRMGLAREAGLRAGVEVGFHVTTNGTIDTPEAWAVMGQEDLRVAVSFDGLPEVHDRFRV